MHDRQRAGLECGEPPDRGRGCDREGCGVEDLLCRKCWPDEVIGAQRGAVAEMREEITAEERSRGLLEEDPSLPIVRDVRGVDVAHALATEVDDLTVRELPGRAV